MNEFQRLSYLNAMGIQVWQEKPVKPAVSVADLDVDTQWDRLAQQVVACQACPLHKTRTQTVFGVGNRRARLLIIGEAPGANEDQQGLPFVGRAGQLLDAMLHAMGLRREDVYIANILKCRPPNNRDPEPTEVAQCTPFLQRQVGLIKPDVILAVGRIAAHYLLKTNTALGQLRGRPHVFDEGAIPLWVTYHPAYLLRSPREKRKALDDLSAVMRQLSDDTHHGIKI